QFPVSFDEYATHFVSGENCALRTIHFGCRYGLAWKSGNAKFHSSCSFRARTYLSSRDQSQTPSALPPKSAISCSDPDPSAFFWYILKLSFRLEPYTIRLPSGLQTGISFSPGPNVKRVVPFVANSGIHMSMWRPSLSVCSKATLRPSCEILGLANAPGVPMAPVVPPFLLNHVNCDLSAPLPVCVTKASLPATPKRARSV